MVPLIFAAGTLLIVLTGERSVSTSFGPAVAADIGAETLSRSRLDGRWVY
jgi:hypothetical protein